LVLGGTVWQSEESSLVMGERLFVNLSIVSKYRHKRGGQKGERKLVCVRRRYLEMLLKEKQIDNSKTTRISYAIQEGKP